jgi:hypothetical protein
MLKQAHPNFVSQFPKSAAPVAKGGLALVPATVGDVQHQGFDENDVKAVLGNTRFNNLMTAIIGGKPYSGAVFCCGHAKDPKTGVEHRCIYASDLELFLANGG